MIRNLAWVASLLALLARARAELIHGLALVQNGPAKVGLATVEVPSGEAAVVGAAHDELFGVGDTLLALAE